MVDELAGSGCEVVVVTPAHQFPTGVVMSSERRSALLEWAEDEDALIVEDDYDSELRYDRVPVGALQGLAPERVLPHRVGEQAARAGIADRLDAVAVVAERGARRTSRGWPGARRPRSISSRSPTSSRRGELDRHLRRMRLRYRERRRAVIDELSRTLPGARVPGVAAGLYALDPAPARDR